MSYFTFIHYTPWLRPVKLTEESNSDVSKEIKWNMTLPAPEKNSYTSLSSAFREICENALTD